MSESLVTSNDYQLREYMPKGSTVFTILRHVSRSGMQREIGVVVFLPPGSRQGWPAGQLVDIHPNYRVAEALGRRMNKAGDGVICHGAGMDMGFELVYSLAQRLYGDGYALTARCL